MILFISLPVLALIALLFYFPDLILKRLKRRTERLEEEVDYYIEENKAIDERLKDDRNENLRSDFEKNKLGLKNLLLKSLSRIQEGYHNLDHMIQFLPSVWWTARNTVDWQQLKTEIKRIIKKVKEEM